MLHNVLLPEVRKTSSALERKLCAVGLVVLVCDISDNSLNELSNYIPELSKVLFDLIRSPQSTVSTKPSDEDELYLADAEETGYQSAFVRLHSISKGEVDLTESLFVSCGVPKDQLVLFIKTKLNQKPSRQSIVFYVSCIVFRST